MSRSLAQEMMDEFLQRQEEYERIYKPYQLTEGRIQSPNLTQRPHKIKDAVKLAHSKYLEQNSTLRKIKRMENLMLRMDSTIKAKDLNNREIQRKKYLDNKQIDLGLVLVIGIPLNLFERMSGGNDFISIKKKIPSSSIFLNKMFPISFNFTFQTQSQ